MKFIIVIIGLLLLALHGCEMKEHPCNGEVYASIVARDYSRWICGGHYLLLADEVDTLRVRDGQVMGDFFKELNANQSSDNFPIGVVLQISPLADKDPCKDFLVDVDCISSLEKIFDL